MSSKRPREREPDSQEPEEKKKVGEDSSSNPILRPSAIPAPKTKSSGLFRASKLAAPDVSKIQQQLQDKQDQEKKESGPIELRDPAQSYHPAVDNGTKQLTVPTVSKSTTNGTGATFGTFGNGASVVKLETNGDAQKPKSNPFAKVAQQAGERNGFGFGAIKKEASEPNSNPFGRIANTESTWAKPEPAPVKTEPESAENAEKSDSTIDSKTEIITGEEEEKNVLQINAKLFQFDKDNQTYSERGRGILRMNDRGEGIEFGSRIVFRTTGTQRLALNTKLWAGMSVEQVSQKSVRISAQDQTTGVGVFLLQTNVADSKELFKAIDSRILQMRQNQERRSSDIEPSKEPIASS